MFKYLPLLFAVCMLILSFIRGFWFGIGVLYVCGSISYGRSPTFRNFDGGHLLTGIIVLILLFNNPILFLLSVFAVNLFTGCGHKWRD